jgi:polyisoprenoid-binding protein YceI
VEVLRPYYLCAHCGVGQFPVDVELDIENTEFSPGVRRMQAMVGQEAPFDHGREQMKVLDHDPLITFHSSKIVQTGPTTFDVPGTFTIRGVSKAETLSLMVSGKGTGTGDIKGTMAFDRKDNGMNSGIPFIKIADRVEVTVDLHGKRVSGPPLSFKE